MLILSLCHPRENGVQLATVQRQGAVSCGMRSSTGALLGWDARRRTSAYSVLKEGFGEAHYQFPLASGRDAQMSETGPGVRLFYFHGAKGERMKAERDRKRNSCRVRLTDAQYHGLRTRAATVGVKPAELLRRLIVQAMPDSGPTREEQK